MNVVILQGRFTNNPEVRHGQDANQTAIARYTLAVDRYRKKDGESNTDFIRCVTFANTAQFAERYLTKGMKITVRGRIQTGSYTNRDGIKVYTTEVVVEEHAFCESRQNGAQRNAGAYNGQSEYQNYQGQAPTYQNNGRSQNSYANNYNGARGNVPGNPAQNYPAPPAANNQASGYRAPQSAATPPSYGGPSGAGYSSPNGSYQIPNGNTNSKPNYTKDPSYDEGFMNIPDGIDEELPFN